MLADLSLYAKISSDLWLPDKLWLLESRNISSSNFSSKTRFDLGPVKSCKRILHFIVAKRITNLRALQRDAMCGRQACTISLLRWYKLYRGEAQLYPVHQHCLPNFSGVSWTMRGHGIGPTASPRTSTESATHSGQRIDWKWSDLWYVQKGAEAAFVEYQRINNEPVRRGKIG